DTPLNFAANTGDNVGRKLGQTMKILGGGATDNGETYSAGNVLTELDEKGDLTIKLADNATFASVTTGNTVMNSDGLTIKDGPSITTGGINAGNKVISNVTDGKVSADSTDAVNGSQLHTTNTELQTLKDTPLNFAANTGDNVGRKLGQTMKILGGGATDNGETYSAGNVLTELDEKGDLTIKLADNATFASVTTGNTV
ncbi:hypothetical protein JEM64_27230, partial [Klebsiella oxytoca]|nr:hypothetical protein [Klebsiella oxytoca]